MNYPDLTQLEFRALAVHLIACLDADVSNGVPIDEEFRRTWKEMVDRVAEANKRLAARMAVK